MRQYGRREFLKAAGLVLAASSVGILSGCGDPGSGSGAGNGSSSGNGGDSGNTPGGDSSGTDPEPGGDSSETPADPTQVQPVFTKVNGAEVRFDGFCPAHPTRWAHTSSRLSGREFLSHRSMTEPLQSAARSPRSFCRRRSPRSAVLRLLIAAI